MKQGEIWYADLSAVKGSEQSGYRPVLIISGNLMNTHAPVVYCCPLTTKLKHYKGDLILKPKAENGLKATSEVLAIHLRSMAKERLIEKIGQVTEEELLSMHKTIGDLMRY
jgi:mRNA interferase MazF